MKIKKLDARGVAHQFALIAVVVIFAVSGVGYMVASHADACNTTKLPVSYVSGADTKANCAASFVACNISGMPGTGTYNSVMHPKLNMTNSGKKTTKLSIYAKRSNLDSSGHVVSSTVSIYHSSVKSKQTVSRNLKSLKVKYSGSTDSIVYSVSFANNGIPACSAQTWLPVKPGTTSSGLLGLNLWSTTSEKRA